MISLSKSNWEETTLGKVIELHYGKGITNEDRDENGKYPIYGANGILGKTNKYLIDGEAIIVGRKGSAGEVNRVSGKFWPSDVTYYVLGNEKVDIDFLYYLFKKVNLKQFATGIKPGVNRNKVYETKALIPPIEQQKQIVKRILSLIPQVESNKLHIANAKDLTKKFKHAILTAAITGKLTEDWRIKNNKTETATDLLKKLEVPKSAKISEKNFDLANLPQIPRTWSWVNFNQIGELARGKSKHRPRNDKRLFGGEYPFIQTGNVARSGGKISTYAQTYNDFGLAQSRLFPKGTLCITIAANIADAGILQMDACFPDSIVGFIPYNPIPSAEFFYYFVTTAKENIEQFAPGTTQKNINLAILSDLAVPLPPLEEQSVIVKRVEAYLEVASTIEAQINNAESRVSEISQSILSKVFSHNYE